MRALLLGVLVLLASAAEPTLSGRWTLDRAASDDLDAFLEAQGFGGLERAIAKRMKVTHVVEDAGATVRVRMESALRTTDKTYTVDGVERMDETPEGPVASTFTRSEGGGLHSVSRGVTRDGAPFQLTTDRVLRPDGAMELVLVLVREGGTPITVRRVFRREGEPTTAKP